MIFQHDCPHCEPLGEFNGYDLYFCPQDGFPTYVARYGDSPESYKSGMFLVESDEEIGEAYFRHRYLL